MSLGDYMAKFKVGEVVFHTLAQKHVRILEVSQEWRIYKYISPTNEERYFPYVAEDYLRKATPKEQLEYLIEEG